MQKNLIVALLFIIALCTCWLVWQQTGHDYPMDRWDWAVTSVDDGVIPIGDVPMPSPEMGPAEREFWLICYKYWLLQAENRRYTMQQEQLAEMNQKLAAILASLAES
ncbi:MAG: hypothetical protein R3244_11385 [Thermoanaerobaculia bacterium]|nr:hypothetical protein [Thermoanaerobaculia bacterium]